MLFAAANVYAPGQAGQQGMGDSSFQNVNRLGRFDLSNLKPPNVLLALALIVALIWAWNRWH